MEPDNPEEIPISDLLKKDNYIIPLYQRNYSWTQVETVQLMQDIWDKYYDDESSCYYVGTLVVDLKEGEAPFEVIDGQQRLITFALINAVFKNYNHSREGHSVSDASLPANDPNLWFEARPKVNDFITQLYKDIDVKSLLSSSDSDEEIQRTLSRIGVAVENIQQFLHDKSKSSCKKEKIKKYADYFYEKVRIIRAPIPPGTDVNHYFEIMNTRGEQLEQHEILKAEFIDKICPEGTAKQNNAKMKAFNVIWEACSQMDRFVERCFKKDLREKLFNEDELATGNCLEKLEKYFSEKDKESAQECGKDNPDTGVGGKDNTIENIIKEPSYSGEDGKTEEYDKESKYVSIIDFSNFLLQVLSIYKDPQKGSGNESLLDDKKLLKNFGCYDDSEFPDPEKFIHELLKYRFIFDRYIIKRLTESNAARWFLKMKSTTDDVDEDDETNDSSPPEKPLKKKLIMTQSMLHVSFPGNSYKKWLYEALKYLGEQYERIKLDEFIEKLERFSRDYYQGIIEKTTADENSSDENSSVLDQGTNTPHFVFNYLDYLLWKKYTEEENKKTEAFIESLHENSNFDKDFINKVKQKVENFQFLFNNSIEHLFPQSKVDGLNAPNVDKGKVIDNFGNLCLISRERNTRFLNDPVRSKKENFVNKLNKYKRIESLKQLVMFSYHDWGEKEIKHHGKQMKQVLSDMH